VRRKNTKFIDPRYFMDEKTEVLEEGLGDMVAKVFGKCPVHIVKHNDGHWAAYNPVAYGGRVGGKWSESPKPESSRPELTSDQIIQDLKRDLRAGIEAGWGNWPDGTGAAMYDAGEIIGAWDRNVKACADRELKNLRKQLYAQYVPPQKR